MVDEFNVGAEPSSISTTDIQDVSSANPKGLNDATGSYPTTIPEHSSFLIFFDCSGHYSTWGYYSYERSDHLGWVTGSEVSYHNVAGITLNGTAPTPFHVDVTDNGLCMVEDGNIAEATSSIGVDNMWYKVPSSSSIGSSDVESGLSPGLYKLVNTNGCEEVSLVFSIHQKAPLVNAGPNKMFCSSGPPSIGSLDPLPTTATYSWAPTTVLCSNCTTTTATAAGSYTITASEGGCTSTDIVSISLPSGTSDVMIRDSEEDIGSEPNTESAAALGSYFWLSNDIWVRNTNDDEPYHQDPTHVTNCTSAVNSNYIYVRLTNRTCEAIDDGVLDLYYTKGSTGLEWSDNWINYTCDEVTSRLVSTLWTVAISLIILRESIYRQIQR
jgi:hypothetical protein